MGDIAEIGTGEGDGQGGEELRARAFGELLHALGCPDGLGAARQGLKDRCRVLQQDFDHRESGGKVGIDADQMQLLLPFLRWLGWVVDETKDGQDHRKAKEDEAETTDGGDDVVAEELSVAKLGGLEEGVELVLLCTAEGELDALLREGLVEVVEVAAYLLELLIGDGAGAGKHVVPDQLRGHDIEDETAEESVFGIRDEIEDLLGRS